MLESTNWAGILAPPAISTGTLSKIFSVSHSFCICAMVIIIFPRMIPKFPVHTASPPSAHRWQRVYGLRAPYLEQWWEMSPTQDVYLLESTRPQAPLARLGLHTCWRQPSWIWWLQAANRLARNQEPDPRNQLVIVNLHIYSVSLIMHRVALIPIICMCACCGTGFGVLSGGGCLRKPLGWWVCMYVLSGDTQCQLTWATLSAAFARATEAESGLVLDLNLGVADWWMAGWT